MAFNLKEYQKERYRKNKDKINKKQKEYNFKNRDNIKSYNLKRRYNITPEQLANMYLEQGDSCKICNIHKDDTPRGLVIDHNHKTLEVRGLLCNDCNSGIGMLKENPEFLDKAKQYLKTKGKYN